ncbi:MAG: glycosyltransferase family 2 protein [Bacteroidota bacterium]
MNSKFSFIILTLNEEIHLPKLLKSLEPLSAKIYVLDSGSTDDTISICARHDIETFYHKFHSHPLQWHFALNHFQINTPWTIGLDADQIISQDLCEMLLNFNENQNVETNGIYFNRKYLFKGSWIRHGGYYPKYLLKMFRTGIGYSDLNEHMDHRFQVLGKHKIWKKGYLIEENIKENKISFWIDKHNFYSDILAEGVVRTRHSYHHHPMKNILFGSPNERNAWLKWFWYSLPKYLRPFLYFTYRMVFKLGIFDGKTGIIFHFLQAFWFRLLVDIKIDELEKLKHNAQSGSK